MSVILGIETSCDETSASVLEGTGNDVHVRSLVILSQDVHRVFGGVVPEIASRAHLTALVPVVERALADAECTFDDIDAVGVTHAPGLIGALLVGVSYAKAVAFARGIPVIGAHHLEGHVFAQSLEHAEAVPPFTCLLVSGGHTMLLDVAAWGDYRMLGRTRDDAAGEAFDKVAKLLGLPYPGGPHLEALARDGDPGRAPFSTPMLHSGQTPGSADYYDMSFSGLKTAVRRAMQSLNGASGVREASGQWPEASGQWPETSGLTPAASGLRPVARHADIARGFQDALVETLVEKTMRAARAYARTRIVLAGGVACNRALINAMQTRAAPIGARVFAPSARLATDNAAMIARAALFHFERGAVADLRLTAYASRDIPGLRTAA